MYTSFFPVLRNVCGVGTLFIALVLVGRTGDAHAGSGVYEVVREPTLMPGDSIPEPTGPVVLEVTGRIAADQDGTVAFDMATLESLGLVRFTTATEWTEKPIAFDGVLLSQLLDVVGADPEATTLQLTALNDYRVPMPISDASRWPVILAIKEDGEYMSLRERGPIWVVYPQHAYSELGSREYLSRWVWQLATITVE